MSIQSGANPGAVNSAGTTPAPGGVTSVFGRTGAVVAVSGDYGSDEITNESSVAGATVSDALDSLEANSGVTSVFGRTGAVVAVSGDYGSDEITNESSVAGATVSDALETLANQISTAYKWFWANATARTAETLSISDLGLEGYQLDMELAYKVVGDGSGGVTLARLDDPRFPLKRFIIPLNNSTVSTSVLGVNSAVFTSPGGGFSARNASAGTNVATRQTRFGFDTPAIINQNETAVWGNPETNNNPLVPSAGFRARSGVVLIGSANMYWNLQIYTAAKQSANVDPNTQLNFVGMGRGTESNVQIYHNDGSGLATQIDCGSNFPATTTGEGYNIEVFTFSGTTWAVQVTRVNTGHAFSTSFSSDLPTPLQGGPAWFLTNLSDAVIDAADIVGFVSEHRAL